MSTLNSQYGKHLDRAAALVEDELGRWPWHAVPRMEQLVRAQLARPGKQLRPLLALVLVDVFGGRPERAYAGCVGVELFHMASLILDDIQDNSDLRHGAPTVHTTAGVATAINLAGVMRTLSYHPLSRCDCLDDAETLAIHRRIDTAATQLFLGQTIDIGWQAGWYSDPDTFPYEEMIEWKTGGLFGCAAWIGAFVSGAEEEALYLADEFGTRFGAFYQVLNDYLDVFGGDCLGRAGSEDLREGKLTRSVKTLLDHVAAADRPDLAREVMAAIAARSMGPHDPGRMIELMRTFHVADALAADLWARAQELTGMAENLTKIGGTGTPNLVRLTEDRFAQLPALVGEAAR